MNICFKSIVYRFASFKILAEVENINELLFFLFAINPD